MASSPSKTPGVPPKIPKRSSSKRTRKQLETDYTLLFDANYWLLAAAASDVSAKIHEYRNDPANILKKQLGKGFWATKGRYLKRAFLLVIAEEIGHDTGLCDNTPMEPGDDNEPDETGVIGIAKLLRYQKRRYEDWYEEDEDEDEGEN